MVEDLAMPVVIFESGLRNVVIVKLGPTEQIHAEIHEAIDFVLTGEGNVVAVGGPRPRFHSLPARDGRA